MAATTGVFPLPPTTRLPTLITGVVSRRRAEVWPSYQERRKEATRP